MLLQCIDWCMSLLSDQNREVLVLLLHLLWARAFDSSRQSGNDSCWLWCLDFYIPNCLYSIIFKHWFVTRYTTKITARLLDGFQDIAISWYQKVKPFWVLLQQEMMKTASVTIRTLKHMQSLHLAAVVSPWSHTNSFFYRPDNIPETNQQCQSKLLLIYNKIYAKI